MSSKLKLIRDLYDAFARGDVPAVLGALDPDIQWTEAEGFPLAGTYQGPQAVLDGVFMPLVTQWDGFSVNPNEFIDGGDNIVVTGRYRGIWKENGKALDCDFAHLWTVTHGKATRFKQFVDSKLVHDAMS